MKRLTQIHWRKSVLLLLAATMVAPLAIVACGGAGGGSGNVVSGATLTIAIPEDVEGTNPWARLERDSSTYTASVFGNRYTSLYGLSDQKFQFVPGNATDFPSEFEREGEFWTVVIPVRDDITWSDGEKLDAADLVFTLETAKEFKLSANWATFIPSDWYERVEVVDGQNAVKYYLKALDEDGNVQTPGLSIWQFGILFAPIYAEHYWQPRIDAITPASCADDDTECEQDRRNALYDLDIEGEPHIGPVNFVEWREGSFVGLERNGDSYLIGSEVTQLADGTVRDTTVGVTNEWLAGTQGGSADDVDLNYSLNFDLGETIFRVYSNQNAAILALREGDVDYFLSPLGLTTGLRAQVEGQPNIDIVENPSNGFRYLTFNFDREPFDDKAFRQAVAWLINRELLADDVFQGAFDAVYSVVPEANGNWFNPDSPQIGRLVIDPEDPQFQAPVLDADGAPVTNEDGTPQTRTKADREVRVERAVALLKEAGYTWEREPTWDVTARRIIEGTGLRKPDGAPITQRERLLADGTTETINTPLELLSPSAGYDTFRSTSALLIEQWLTEFGIPVDARLRGFNELSDQVFSPLTEDGSRPLRNWDMYILGWGLTIYPSFLTAFFTEAQAGPNGFNAQGYVSEEFEAEARIFDQAQDTETARLSVYRMQDILGEDLPYITLFQAPIAEAYSRNLQFAYTDVLDGIQNLFGGAGGPLASASITAN